MGHKPRYPEGKSTVWSTNLTRPNQTKPMDLDCSRSLYYCASRSDMTVPTVQRQNCCYWLKKKKKENPPNISAEVKMSDNMKMLWNKNYKLSPSFFPLHVSRLIWSKSHAASLDREKKECRFFTWRHKTSVSSMDQDSFLSLVSLLSITPTGAWMIHWEKNESTCGYMSNLPDWHCCISLKPTQATLENITSGLISSNTTDKSLNGKLHFCLSWL